MMSLEGYRVTHNLSASQKSPLCEGGDLEGVAGSVRKASTLHPATPSQPLPLHKGKGECNLSPTPLPSGEGRMHGAGRLPVSYNLSENGTTLQDAPKSPLCEAGDLEGVAGSVWKAFRASHPPTPSQPLPLHKGKGEYTALKAVPVSQKLSENGSAGGVQ